MTTARQNDNGYFRLPPLPTGAPTPVEIVVAKLKLVVSGTDVLFKLDVKAYEPMDIIDLVKVLTGAQTTPVPRERPRPAPTVPSEHPLEIWVGDPCTVLVMVEGSELRFRANGPAITSKADYGHDNAGLRHIAFDYKPMSDRNPGPGCRYAYFTMIQRGRGERQSFNFHLDLKQGDAWLEIAVDPDVPDDGGGVPGVGS